MQGEEITLILTLITLVLTLIPLILPLITLILTLDILLLSRCLSRWPWMNLRRCVRSRVAGGLRARRVQ